MGLHRREYQVELLSDQKVPALDIALSICNYTQAEVGLQIQAILGHRMRLGAVGLPAGSRYSLLCFKAFG